MLVGFVGLTGINGITGTMGTTGVMGMVEVRVPVKGICAVEGGVKGGLLGVDDELGESGVDRNKALIGVKIGFG